MSMWFSRYTEYLEAELARLRTEHAEQIKSLRQDFNSELEYARSELKRRDEELEYLRRCIVANANLPRPSHTVATTSDADGLKKLAAAIEGVPTGSPWQRVLQRYKAQWDKDEAEDKRKKQPGAGVAHIEEPKREETVAAKEN
jgi:Tfp pilus assembly protein FimV